MDELIKRLKAATGPDRELDAAIAPLVGLRMVEEGHPLGSCCYDEKGHGVPLPAFTTSIDAALTLVPEGWGEYTLMNANGYHEATFNNHEAKRTAWGASDASPALAICIAALRARGEV